MQVSGSNKKTVLLGVLLIAFAGLAAFTFGSGDGAQFHLSRANNILRRWSCPPGGYPSGPGQKGSCLCSKCPTGKKCAGGYNPPRPCAAGSYQNVMGQSSCKPTPPGSHNPIPGGSSPVPCGYGTYNPHQGKRACTRASPGHHVPGRGATKQTKCAAPKYQNLSGQKNCKPAKPGTYVDKPGQTGGTPCNYGTYNPSYGQRACTRASPGHYVPGRGAKGQARCGRNTFQSCSGQVNCIPCEAPKQSSPGARACSLAPAGSCSAETRIDNPGGDMRGQPKPARSIKECQDRCLATRGCKCWATDYPRVTVCWLKNVCRPSRRSNSRASGMCGPHLRPKCSLDRRIDNPGGDMPHMPQHASSIGQCQERCRRTPGCRCWATDYPRVSVCWLKNVCRPKRGSNSRASGSC